MSDQNQDKALQNELNTRQQQLAEMKNQLLAKFHGILDNIYSSKVQQSSAVERELAELSSILEMPMEGLISAINVVQDQQAQKGQYDGQKQLSFRNSENENQEKGGGGEISQINHSSKKPTQQIDTLGKGSLVNNNTQNSYLSPQSAGNNQTRSKQQNILQNQKPIQFCSNSTTHAKRKNFFLDDCEFVDPRISARSTQESSTSKSYQNATSPLDQQKFQVEKKLSGHSHQVAMFSSDKSARTMVKHDKGAVIYKQTKLGWGSLDLSTQIEERNIDTISQKKTQKQQGEQSGVIISSVESVRNSVALFRQAALSRDNHQTRGFLSKRNHSLETSNITDIWNIHSTVDRNNMRQQTMPEQFKSTSRSRVLNNENSAAKTLPKYTKNVKQNENLLETQSAVPSILLMNSWQSEGNNGHYMSGLETKSEQDYMSAKNFKSGQFQNKNEQDNNYRNVKYLPTKTENTQVYMGSMRETSEDNGRQLHQSRDTGFNSLNGQISYDEEDTKNYLSPTKNNTNKYYVSEINWKHNRSEQKATNTSSDLEYREKLKARESEILRQLDEISLGTGKLNRGGKKDSENIVSILEDQADLEGLRRELDELNIEMSNLDLSLIEQGMQSRRLESIKVKLMNESSGSLSQFKEEQELLLDFKKNTGKSVEKYLQALREIEGDRMNNQGKERNLTEGMNDGIEIQEGNNEINLKNDDRKQERIQSQNQRIQGQFEISPGGIELRDQQNSDRKQKSTQDQQSSYQAGLNMSSTDKTSNTINQNNDLYNIKAAFNGQNLKKINDIIEGKTPNEMKKSHKNTSNGMRRKKERSLSQQQQSAVIEEEDDQEGEENKDQQDEGQEQQNQQEELQKNGMGGQVINHPGQLLVLRSNLESLSKTKEDLVAKLQTLRANQEQRIQVGKQNDTLSQLITANQRLSIQCAQLGNLVKGKKIRSSQSSSNTDNNVDYASVSYPGALSMSEYLRNLEKEEKNCFEQFNQAQRNIEDLKTQIQQAEEDQRISKAQILKRKDQAAIRQSEIIAETQQKIMQLQKEKQAMKSKHDNDNSSTQSKQLRVRAGTNDFERQLLQQDVVAKNQQMKELQERARNQKENQLEQIANLTKELENIRKKINKLKEAKQGRVNQLQDSRKSSTTGEDNSYEDAKTQNSQLKAQVVQLKQKLTQEKEITIDGSIYQEFLDAAQGQVDKHASLERQLEKLGKEIDSRENDRNNCHQELQIIMNRIQAAEQGNEQVESDGNEQDISNQSQLEDALSTMTQQNVIAAHKVNSLKVIMTEKKLLLQKQNDDIQKQFKPKLEQTLQQINDLAIEEEELVQNRRALRQKIAQQQE